MPKVQASFAEPDPVREKLVTSRRELVKQTFQRGWSSYHAKAWMKDELAPLTGRGTNAFGGWAATLVDALDTLWIMDMKDEFSKAVTAAMDIDFTTSTDETINVFETTIRYLGGFLGAYDLSGDRRLLDKAVEVGEMLLVPFDTPNHMPITRWNWRDGKSGSKQEAPSGMLVSELGSLSLEFTRLSQLTGDDRWYDAINRISELFHTQQMSTKLPGMWPISVNPRDKDLSFDTAFTFGGMSDSLYEYFPKEYALLGGLVPMYKDMYVRSMAAASDALLVRPMTPGENDILIPGDARANDDGSSYVTTPRGQHLGCFAGGMYALGGRLFSNPNDVTTGGKITEGCIWAYNAMPYGIMPEIASFVTCPSKSLCEWDKDKWLAAVLEHEGGQSENRNAESIVKSKNLPEGFVSIDDRRYILRPEAIESVFILYRVTGNKRYQEAAWDMFNAIENVTRTELANAAISDISAVGEPPKDDRMESFWFAETLKYFYLIFSDAQLISLDEYVLNTEAHPLRRPT